MARLFYPTFSLYVLYWIIELHAHAILLFTEGDREGKGIGRRYLLMNIISMICIWFARRLSFGQSEGLELLCGYLGY